MATTITVAGSEIDYQDFRIEVPLSPLGVAPTAVIETRARQAIAPNDDVIIDIDGTTAFDGVTESPGKIRRDGSAKVKCKHRAVDLFEEDVTFTAQSDFDKQVLDDALAASDSGSNFTLDDNFSAVSLDNSYSVENRPLKRVFRDMMDRGNNVWWVEPGGSTIHVEPLGDRGQWQALDAEADSLRVNSYEDGTVNSVRNDVTVVGTGGEKVEGTATDSTSISNYGRQSETVQVSYITGQSEADSMASALIVPDPLASGELVVSKSVGDVVQPLANFTIALDDASKDISETGLVVEKQTITQGKSKLQFGEGAGINFDNVNRRAKSDRDVTEPGSVYNSDRIADFAILEDKIADLSISETKIQDDSISTPKLQANSVTAGEIEAGTITALEIDTLDLDTNELSIGANVDEQITFGTDTISTTDVVTMLPSSDGLAFIGRDATRFNEIFTEGMRYEAGTFEPPAATTTVGWGTDDDDEPSFIPNTDNSARLGGVLAGSNVGFNNVFSHNFTTLTPEPMSGSVDLSKLSGYSWESPPEYAAQQKARNDDTREYIRQNPSNGVELSHMANWLLEACKSQQNRIDELEERLSKLERQN